jgi:hypothetical protein
MHEIPRLLANKSKSALAAQNRADIQATGPPYFGHGALVVVHWVVDLLGEFANMPDEHDVRIHMLETSLLGQEHSCNLSFNKVQYTLAA